MKCLLILLIFFSPLIMDLFRDYREYKELCVKCEEDDRRAQEIVNQLNNNKL